MEIGEVLKVLIPGLVAAAGSVLATQYLEPRRQRLARESKLAELRFEAHRKLVAALTRLDIDSADFAERRLMQVNSDRAGELMSESLRLALLQFAESRYLLDDAQLGAVREFFLEFDRAMWSPNGGWEQDIPSASQLVRERFDPGLSMNLSSPRPPRLVHQAQVNEKPAALPDAPKE